MSTCKKPNNPEAFPVLDPNGSFWNPGMSLRDYFANSAMQSLVKKRDTSFNSKDIRPSISHLEVENMTRHSYQIADAMLKQREL